MDNQDHHDNNGACPAVPEPAISAAGAARRRFARSGIGASGVILTLASQPGMASVICKSPSGSLSDGLHSQPGGQTVVCGGLSPGYWKKPSRTWPSGVKRTTLFSSVFPGGGTGLYQTGTMLAMLTNNDPSKDPYNLAMHLVATYLNVLSGKISFLKVTELKKIWNDFVTYGYYVPRVNVTWYAEDLKRYFEKTHD